MAVAGGRRMVAAALALGLGGGLLGGCAAGPDPQLAQRARVEMVGLPKDRLLACAGVPDRQATVDGKEYYTYVERPGAAVSPTSSLGLGVGGGSASGVGVGIGLGLPLVGGGGTGCEATFVLGGGVVEQLSYPANAALSACTPIVQNCLAPAPR